MFNYADFMDVHTSKKLKKWKKEKKSENKQMP